MSEQDRRGCGARTSADATSMRAASRAFPRFSCACLFLLDHVQEHIWNTQVLYLRQKVCRDGNSINKSGGAQQRRTVLPRM